MDQGHTRRATGEKVANQEADEWGDVAKGWLVAIAWEGGADLVAATRQSVAPLLTDRDDRAPGARRLKLFQGEADQVAVQGASKAAIGGEEHDRTRCAALRSAQEWVPLVAQHCGEVGDDLVD